MRKSEMKVGVTYIICPDRKCKLFYDMTRWCPCDDECPQKDKLRLVIICHYCGKMIILPGDHSFCSRIDHEGQDGCGAINFRMSGKYHLLYKIPTE